MKIICTLTDQEVLGTGGLSSAVPRHTARAIVKNTAGLYAVMYAPKFHLYSLPGGGVEEGEDPLTALHREIFEETGCTCDTVEELGIVAENRFCYDFTQVNHYYLVTTQTTHGRLHLTEKETAAGTEVQWHTLEDVLHLIADVIHDSPQRKYIQARDVAALRTYAEKGHLS